MLLPAIQTPRFADLLEAAVLERGQPAAPVKERLPREPTVLDGNSAPVRVRRGLVHVDGEVNDVLRAHLGLDELVCVLEEAAALLLGLSLEELRACGDDALNELHRVLAHLPARCAVGRNLRIDLGGVLPRQIAPFGIVQLVIQVSPLRVDVRVQMLAGGAVVVVLHRPDGG